MTGKHVEIKYQYYQLCTIIGDEQTEYAYDLRPWILNVYPMRLEERIRSINGIDGRLEDVQKVHNNEFFALNFMRLDVVSNTYVVAPNVKARHVNLEDDEYIGKNTVMLYDPRHHVVMVQCNRGSYGVAALESYINSFISDGDICYFRPIYYDYGHANIGNARYTKLDIRFANVRDVIPTNNVAFERIVSVCNQTECVTAHLELGLGHNYKKSAGLEPDTIQGIISEVRRGENRQAISSARVTLSDDQKSEVFDLLENILHDRIGYNVPARGELLFSTLSQAMANRYEGSTRARVNNLLTME